MRRRPCTSLALVLGLTLSGLTLAAGVAAAPAKAATTTFTATEDTFVESDKAAQNFGRATTVQVDGSPRKTTLLKFSVSGLGAGVQSGGVQSVRLRLFCTGDPSVAGGQVRTVASTSWSEATVTYATAPAIGATVLATLPKVVVGTWYEVDVTAAVPGDGTYAFAVSSTNADGAAFAAKDAGSSTAPRLVVTTPAQGADTTAPSVPIGVTATAVSATAVSVGWQPSTDDVGVTGYRVYRDGVRLADVGAAGSPYADATVSAGSTHAYAVDAVDAAGNRSARSVAATVTTPVAGGQTSVTFGATKDTYVEQDTPAVNYGAAKSFYTDASPAKMSLLTFDVTGIAGPVQSARLRIYCASDPSVAGGEAHRLLATSWTESGVTWNTAPAVDPVALSRLGTVATGRWYELDVTAAVAGNGTYGFAVTSPNADGANYASKEAGTATAPQLVLVLASTVADTTAPSVSLASPPAGATVSGSGVTLTADATDNVAVARVTFTVDGVAVGTPVTATPFLLDWDTRSVADGSHVIAATAVDGAGNVATSAGVSVTVSNPVAGPCGALARAGVPAPAQYDHVVWIWMENHNYAGVLGPAATGTGYEKTLSGQCATSTQYLDNVTPTLQSLPNYLAATSGSNCVTGLDSVGTGCIVDDGGPAVHTLPTTSLFEQVAAAGKTWKAYQEDMPKACATTGSGLYAVRHNPPLYYTNLTASCPTSDVGFPAISCTATGCPVPASGALSDDIAAGALPAFSFVTPDLCNDTHDCAAAVGDQWLQTWVSRLTAGPNYLSGDTVVVLVWDEGATGGSPIPNIVISPYTTPILSAITMNHFALLRTTQDVLGLVPFGGYLGCASGVQPGTTLPCPAGWDADLRTNLHF